MEYLSRSAPIRMANDGRYFVDRDGQPVFWLGDTQWELFRSYSLSDAETIIQNRKRRGFTFVQVMLLGVDPEENVEGEKPWLGGDPTAPNEAYFQHVDRVIELNQDLGGPVLVIGVYHTVRMRGLVNERNARPWAEWVARRYGGFPGVIWSMYPRAVPEDVPVCRELAAGLGAGDAGEHPITVHPDPSPATSSTVLHDEDWLAFNSIQTFSSIDLIYPMVSADYRLTPTKPVVMAEGAYESGTEYGFEVTPLHIRRQAYYSYLAGGHHSYGHNDSWRVRPSWKEALDAPGAAHMGILKEIFSGLGDWWNLVPDQSVISSGDRTEGGHLRQGYGAQLPSVALAKEGDVLILAARQRRDEWFLAYAGGPAAFTIDVGRFPAAFELHARWIDPRSGDSVPAEGIEAPGRLSFATPEGWADAVMILK